MAKRKPAKKTNAVARRSAALDELDAITREIKQLKRAIVENFYELGKRYARVRDRELFKPRYDTFEDYLETELSDSRETAYKFIRIAESFTKTFALAHGSERVTAMLRYLDATPEDDGPDDLPAMRITVTGKDGKRATKPITRASSREIDRAAKAKRAENRAISSDDVPDTKRAEQFRVKALRKLERAQLDDVKLDVQCSARDGCHRVTLENVKLEDTWQAFTIVARVARGD